MTWATPEQVGFLYGDDHTGRQRSKNIHLTGAGPTIDAVGRRLLLPPRALPPTPPLPCVHLEDDVRPSTHDSEPLHGPAWLPGPS